MVVGLLAFAVYPLVALIILSLSQSLLGKPFQAWVGLDNYRDALGDGVFLASLARSIAFAVPITLVELLLGVAVALLLQGSIRGGHLVRALILLPLMTPPIMVAVAWKLILHPTGGLLNGLLRSLGLTEQPVSFLGSSTWAFPAVGLADAWQWTPFVILLAFAALQSLPEETRQAALVDGASPWRVFWGITLPMLAPALVAIALIRLIMAFKLFDLVYALTQGGPGFDTTVATFQIYRTALERFDVGAGAAQTLLFAVVVSLVTLPVVILRDHALRRFA
jgi:multiple sugar transport system permease protein